MKRLLGLTASFLAVLALAGCGGGSAASPAKAKAGSSGGDAPTTVVDIGSCDPYVSAAEGYLGHAVDVTGTGDPCKYFVPEQVEINGGHYWMDVHFETFPLDEGETDAAAITELLGGGLTTEQAPAGWSYAASTAGELHYVVVAKDNTALHCDASTKPGGGETRPAPEIDPVALLVFCDEIYDTAVEG